MPIKAVKQDVADKINELHSLLKRDYGCDYSFSVNGHGFTLAQHNIYGIELPVPLVDKELDN